MTVKEIEDIALANGYAKEDYGYKKLTKNMTHWATPFDKGGFQLYAYFTTDSELEKYYDTGVIEKASAHDLQNLITILVQNHI